MQPDRSLVGTRSSRSWSELPGNFDSLNCRALFPGDVEWGIPTLPAARLEPENLVAYSSRSEIARAGPGSAVHFFLDDYRFETVWSKPERGLTRIQSIGATLTPDFSLWRDMPLVMQLWQVYRSRWCGAWLSHNGVKVIPTVSWSTRDTWSFAFIGIEPGSVVAVSTVGVHRQPEAHALFDAGYAEMQRRLKPRTVLVYGKILPCMDPARVRTYRTRWG